MPSTNDLQNQANKEDLIAELVDFFLASNMTVEGAQLSTYKPPPAIINNGFGDSRPRYPHVVGLDSAHQRIAFGLVRPDRESLDSEDSLTEYNVFLDHNAEKGSAASIVYVLLPPSLLHEFTGLITHYVHRDYWHRILPVSSRRIA